MQEELDLDNTIITYQSPYDNSFSVNPHIETWPELIIEFSKVLNKAGYFIPIDLIEEAMYDTSKKLKLRLEAEGSEGQLDLPLE
jgi:hypothetical protein